LDLACDRDGRSGDFVAGAQPGCGPGNLASLPESESLPYFKFGVEMKTCFGMKDLLIQESNQFTDPISRLRTRTFVLSLCFEG
jgi:hypothetical protein